MTSNKQGPLENCSQQVYDNLFSNVGLELFSEDFNSVYHVHHDFIERAIAWNDQK